MPSSQNAFPEKSQAKAEIISDLKAMLPKLEGLSAEVLTFGVPEIEGHLPQAGLALGALHEVVPEAAYDLAAAFGFLTALITRIASSDPVLIVLSQRGSDGCGRPYGHGLDALGLDPSRIILVEPREERQALWAMEEALHSGVPAAVAGIIGKDIDLKSSQKLQHAARTSGVPLLLLRPLAALEASAAVTRWRIGSAPASRDRFGLIARWCWRVRLERCRNGNSAEWLLEWDHDALCFRLAAALAGPALSDGRSPQSFARAG